MKKEVVLKEKLLAWLKIKMLTDLKKMVGSLWTGSWLLMLGLLLHMYTDRCTSWVSSLLAPLVGTVFSSVLCYLSLSTF